MLKIECPEHLEATKQFAATLPGEVAQSLFDGLARLERFGCTDGGEVDLTRSETRLYKDFAKYSFAWSAWKPGAERPWYVGGLIYHGQGAGETFSVTLEPCSGWQIHT